ncbi:hypothetical protein [Streptomyces yangpuensis]|uniref:hypothetical protein n=1 Tax=Streptomyces yangpuensis TaxID=1648182 RepID=UPI003724072F
MRHDPAVCGPRASARSLSAQSGWPGVQPGSAFAFALDTRLFAVTIRWAYGQARISQVGTVGGFGVANASATVLTCAPKPIGVPSTML